jgi:hypothetical protein
VRMRKHPKLKLQSRINYREITGWRLQAVPRPSTLKILA